MLDQLAEESGKYAVKEYPHKAGLLPHGPPGTGEYFSWGTATPQRWKADVANLIVFSSLMIPWHFFRQDESHQGDGKNIQTDILWMYLCRESWQINTVPIFSSAIYATFLETSRRHALECRESYLSFTMSMLLPRLYEKKSWISFVRTDPRQPAGCRRCCCRCVKTSSKIQMIGILLDW